MNVMILLYNCRVVCISILIISYKNRGNVLLMLYIPNITVTGVNAEFDIKYGKCEC